MTFASSSAFLNGFQTLIQRSMSGLVGQRYAAEVFDPYDPAPVTVAALKDMFRNADGAPWTPDGQLRASERREHDSMSLIRNALYPADLS